MITKEYTSVKTLVDKEGVPAGTIGVVVSVYSDAGTKTWKNRK